MPRSCFICTQEFTPKTNQLKNGMGKYCSRKCYWTSMKGKVGNRKGYKATPEQIESNRISHLGQKAWNKGKEWVEIRGENHPRWVKGTPSYRTMHKRIYAKLGKASICTFNPEHQSTRYHWANISGSYLSDLDDWTSLCAKCHCQYDMIRRGYSQFGRSVI